MSINLLVFIKSNIPPRKFNCFVLEVILFDFVVSRTSVKRLISFVQGVISLPASQVQQSDMASETRGGDIAIAIGKRVDYFIHGLFMLDL